MSLSFILIKLCRGAVLASLLSSLLIVTSCASNSGKSEKIFGLVNDADNAYQKGRWFEASLAYRKVIELVPEDHYAWFRLANTQLREGNIDGAIYTYGQALILAPDHAKTHFNLSIVFVLKSINELERSSMSMRSNDPGKFVIERRINALKGLIDQPTDTPRMSNKGLIRFGSRRLN